MPADRFLKYVPADHPFMLEAAKAREECAGDPLYPVGIVMVKPARPDDPGRSGGDGVVVARAGNGFNRGPGKVHVCPRIVLDCPSGTGYELCDLHDAPGHSERMVLQAAREAHVDPVGADVYMFGHWWACEPCWTALIEAGVRDLYVVDDAHERFSRERVYGETLTPSVRSVYIAGPLTNVEEIERQRAFYELLGSVAEALGCKTCIPHRDSGEQLSPRESRLVYEWATGEVGRADVTVAEVSVPSLGVGGELVEAYRAGKHVVLVSKKGSSVSKFVLGNPAVVYHIEYDDQEDAARQLRNVLRQL